jgi:D-alanyl-D-alanine carboxypeptidase
MRYLTLRPIQRVFIAVLAVLWTAAASAGPSMVVDVKSGRVLHAEDAFELWIPASITKLMTAYVAFKEIEAGRLTLKSPVRVSRRAANAPPSHMAYPIGTIVNLDNALKMLIIKSANDIAIAIAEAASGSVEDFSKRMNEEARNLGMTDSRFVNPNGLYEAGHYSTARDLALLARAIRLEFPQYDAYFSAEALGFGETVARSYNYLIGRFPGADGMKTGYVCESGFNLLGSATRDGKTLIAVVLGEMSSKDRAERAADLLVQGFEADANGGDYPLLNDLEKPERRSEEVADIRSTVCSQEANDARWADRSLDSFDTAALTPMTREPMPVRVGPGNAEGMSRSVVLLFGQYFSDVPQPVERPFTLTDEVNEQRRRARFDLEPKSEVPVPVERPAVET